MWQIFYLQSPDPFLFKEHNFPNKKNKCIKKALLMWRKLKSFKTFDLDKIDYQFPVEKGEKKLLDVKT